MFRASNVRHLSALGEPAGPALGDGSARYFHADVAATQTDSADERREREAPVGV
jgi:hypothetical protein